MKGSFSFSSSFLSLVPFPVFLLPAVLAFTVVLAYALARKVFPSGRDVSRKRPHGGKEGKKSQVGFVVDTFQDLVLKLKENEKELKELRAKAEKRAELIENLSRNILESVPSGVISFNESLEITMVNSAAERILGFKREEAIGRRHDEVLKGEIAVLAGKKEMVCRQEMAFYQEGRTSKAGGRRLWVGFSVTPLLDAAGGRIGLILVFTDLTELKALERQAELRRRLSSLGEMSAGLAHELRNPMAVISGYSKMLSRTFLKTEETKTLNSPAGGEDRQMQRQAALAIEKEVGVMNSIINGFLSFANPGAPAFELMDGPRLTGILKTCLDAALAGAGHIRASLAACREEFTIKADEILLKQAFMNLIQNAAQAMTPAGGALEVSVSKAENELHIAVADTGPGIPEQMRQKVFLPFYTGREGGMGLGLAIVHSIVQSHMGSIEAGTTDKGARFIIRLPLA